MAFECKVLSNVEISHNNKYINNAFKKAEEDNLLPIYFCFRGSETSAGNVIDIILKNMPCKLIHSSNEFGNFVYILGFRTEDKVELLSNIHYILTSNKCHPF